MSGANQKPAGDSAARAGELEALLREIQRYLAYVTAVRQIRPKLTKRKGRIG